MTALISRIILSIYLLARTHGAEHAAALPVRAAAPEEGDEDGADGGDEEEGRRGAVDVHRAVRLK